MSPYTIKESKVHLREENGQKSSTMLQTKSTKTDLQNPRNQMKKNPPSIATFDPTKPPPLLVKKENILRPTKSVVSSNSLKEVQDHSMRSEVDKEIGMDVEFMCMKTGEKKMLQFPPVFIGRAVNPVGGKGIR